MISPSLLAEKQQVDYLIQQVSQFNGDPYLKSLIVHYLCIRISGYVENCVRIIFVEYASTRTTDHAQTFVLSKLERFPNPRWSEILKLASEFCDTWRNDLKSRVTQQHLDSLESININRNAIAHGGTSSITLADLINYYTDVTYLIEQLENVCK